MSDVTVGLPVRNGEAYLEACVRSVLAQSFGDFELVVLDNASTDRTEAIGRDLAASDPRVRYERRPANVGAAANQNGCLERARGRYFHWLHHDDLVAPDYLRRTRAALEADPGLALAFCRVRLIDEGGEPLRYDPGRDVYLDREGGLRAGPAPPDLAGQASPAARFKDVFRRSVTCFHVFGLTRTAVLRRTALHRPVYGSDKCLLAEIALHGRYHEVPEVLFMKREHAGQSLAIPSAEGRARWLDPGARRRLFPHLALQRLNARAALRAPIGLGDRATVLAHCARNLGVRILLDPRNWRATYLDQKTIGRAGEG